MAIGTYTTSIGIGKITSGTEAGSWGTITNANFDLIDTFINGFSEVTLTSTHIVATTPFAIDFETPSNPPAVPTNAAAYIKAVDAGDIGGTGYMQFNNVPETLVLKVENALSAGQKLRIFCTGVFAGSESSAIELFNGETAIIYVNGSANIVRVSSNLFLAGGNQYVWDAVESEYQGGVICKQGGNASDYPQTCRIGTTGENFHLDAPENGSFYFNWYSGVSGDFYFGDGSSSGVGRLSGTGNFTVTGNVTAYGTISDLRRKENVTKIDSALDKVKMINGVSFNYKGKDETLLGVIAQDLMQDELLNTCVYSEKDIATGENTYAVRYSNLIGVLVEAIKEQQELIENLSAKVKAIEEG
jgi:DNA-directed RNA polymerase subunit L